MGLVTVDCDLPSKLTVSAHSIQAEQFKLAHFHSRNFVKKFVLLLLVNIFFSSYAGSIVHHKEGAICDEASGFCADHMGVSVALTKMYLGEKAERNLMAEINKVGIQDFDMTTFTMRGGLTCDTKIKTCWTHRDNKKVDAKATQTLFGK